MNSDNNNPDYDPADVGLLSPVWAGTAVEAVTGDAAIVHALLEVEVALAAAQAKLGLVPDGALDAIRTAATSITVDPIDLARRARSGGNPVIPLLADLRTAVRTVDVDAVRFTHLGTTSQDVLDTALVIVARSAARLITTDLATVASELTRLTDEHRGTVMAARTLTQHSVPTTFGTKVASWLVGVVDAARSLAAATASLPVQLGGAAGTLASFGELTPGREFELVDQLATELGLAAPVIPWHTRRFPITTLGDALATVAHALGTIAADIAVLARTEIAELQEATGGGSTAMPQKQNPVLSILMTSAARSAPGFAAELHRSAIAVDERPDGAWHAEWQSMRTLLRQVGGCANLATRLLPTLRVDVDRMRTNLELTGPLIVSERVALVLGPRLGRDVVGRLVQDSVDDPASLETRLQAAVPEWPPARISALLDPANYLGAVDPIIDRAIEYAKEHP